VIWKQITREVHDCVKVTNHKQRDNKILGLYPVYIIFIPSLFRFVTRDVETDHTWSTRLRKSHESQTTWQ